MWDTCGMGGDGAWREESRAPPEEARPLSPLVVVSPGGPH